MTGLAGGGCHAVGLEADVIEGVEGACIYGNFPQDQPFTLPVYLNIE